MAQLVPRNRKVIDSFGVLVAYFLSVYPAREFVCLKETFKRNNALIFSDQNNNHTARSAMKYTTFHDWWSSWWLITMILILALMTSSVPITMKSISNPSNWSNLKRIENSSLSVARQISVHDCNFCCAHDWKINSFPKWDMLAWFLQQLLRAEMGVVWPWLVAKMQHAVLQFCSFAWTKSLLRAICCFPYAMHAIQTHYAKYA